MSDKAPNKALVIILTASSVIATALYFLYGSVNRKRSRKNGDYRAFHFKLFHARLAGIASFSTPTYKSILFQVL